MFKKYRFTSEPPPETVYDFGLVPLCKGDLSESVLLRPCSRRQWFVCLKELESLARESLVRRAARNGLPTPSGLPLVYIADRMDIDDPLWGYQVRSGATGWLQGERPPAPPSREAPRQDSAGHASPSPRPPRALPPAGAGSAPLPVRSAPLGARMPAHASPRRRPRRLHHADHLHDVDALL